MESQDPVRYDDCCVTRIVRLRIFARIRFPPPREFTRSYFILYGARPSVAGGTHPYIVYGARFVRVIRIIVVVAYDGGARRSRKTRYARPAKTNLGNVPGRRVIYDGS